MQAFSNKHNVSYRVISPSDNSYGVPISKNKFSGVVGMVQHMEVDLGGGLFSMMEDRQRVVDFSASIGVEGYSIMMKTPKKAKTKNVLTPFSLTVWIVILVSAVLMSLIMYVFINVFEKKIGVGDSLDKFSLAQLSWFVYGALVKQGSTLAPSSTISRILFGSWWLFITIVTAFYTAQLTAVLAGSSRALPVNNLEELHSDEEATWVAMGGGAFETIIKSWPEYEALKHDLHTKKGVFVTVNAAAVSAIEKIEDKYFLTDTKAIRKFIFDDYIKESGRCRFTFTENFVFASVPIGLIFPKGRNDLRTMFNSVIQSLVQSGLLYQSMQEVQDNVDLVSVCQGDGEGWERTLLITDVGSTFILTLTGCAVALLIFAGETSWAALRYLVQLCYRLREYDRKLARLRRRQRIRRMDLEIKIHQKSRIQKF